MFFFFFLMGVVTGYKITNHLDTVVGFVKQERVYAHMAIPFWEHRDGPSNFCSDKPKWKRWPRWPNVVELI